MKVLVASDGVFPQVVGGMSRHTYFLARHLAELGVDVTLAHPGPGRAFDGELEEWIVRMPRLPRFPGHYVMESRMYSRRVWEAVRSSGTTFDAVYAQGLSFWAGIGAPGLCVVVNPHGLEMFQAAGPREGLRAGPLRWAMRRQLPRADRVISLGGGLTGLLTSRCGVAPEKVRVVPNAIDVRHVDEKLKGERDYSVNELVCVARLVANKGLPRLIAALEAVEGVHLTVIGDGPLRRALELSARDSGRVTFVGRASDDVLFGALSSATGFVLPTLGEGMPTVVLEAMAAGLPVIGTDVGALSVLVDESSGFLVPPGSQRHLEGALRAWLELSPEARARMGARSRAKVMDRFTWEHVARDTLDVLHECVGAGTA